MPKRAVLLVNLGSPESTSVADVSAYLREFLGDERVIDLPAPLRWLLLEGIILRTRPKRSAHAYEEIWTKDGSPLIFVTEDNKVLKFDAASLPKATALAGHHVKVSGEVAGDTLKVASISAIPMPAK